MRTFDFFLRSYDFNKETKQKNRQKKTSEGCVGVSKSVHRNRDKGVTLRDTVREIYCKSGILLRRSIRSVVPSV